MFDWGDIKDLKWPAFLAVAATAATVFVVRRWGFLATIEDTATKLYIAGIFAVWAVLITFVRWLLNLARDSIGNRRVERRAATEDDATAEQAFRNLTPNERDVLQYLKLHDRSEFRAPITNPILRPMAQRKIFHVAEIDVNDETIYRLRPSIKARMQPSSDWHAPGVIPDNPLWVPWNNPRWPS